MWCGPAPEPAAPLTSRPRRTDADGPRPHEGQRFQQPFLLELLPEAEPHVAGVVDHGAQQFGDQLDVQLRIGVPFGLESPEAADAALDERLAQGQPQLAHLRGEGADLLDQGDDLRMRAVRLDEPRHRGMGALIGVLVVGLGVQRRQHALDGGLRDLAEDRVLGVEVAVEGALGDLGLLDDVGDPRVQEALPLEDPAGGGEQFGPARLSLVGHRAGVPAHRLRSGRVAHAHTPSSPDDHTHSPMR